MQYVFLLFFFLLLPPLDTTEANLPTLTKGMPVAAIATTMSMQRELGKLWLISKAAAASGNKKLQQLKKKLNTALSNYDVAWKKPRCPPSALSQILRLEPVRVYMMSGMVRGALHHSNVMTSSVERKPAEI